jgi:hypothetical protein
LQANNAECRGKTYTTGEKPSAPPQPIRTMANVKVEMTKLCVLVFTTIYDSNFYTSSQDLPNESKSGGVGKAFVVVADVRHFGGEVQLTGC